MIIKQIWNIRTIFYLLILLNWSTSWSEVTLDGTLGASGALDGPDFQITENLGRRAGSNLYQEIDGVKIKIDGVRWGQSQ